MQYDHNNSKLELGSNADTRIAVDSSGNVDVKTGNVVIGTAGKGIDFSAVSHAGGMTSELLDVYEEGTFTPTMRTTNDATQPSYSNKSGVYTRIGNICHYELAININGTIGSTSGDIEVHGLPFNGGVGASTYWSSPVPGSHWGRASPSGSGTTHMRMLGPANGTSHLRMFLHDTHGDKSHQMYPNTPSNLYISGTYRVA